MDLTRYNTLVFDCDGVILDSNKIKTRAFWQAALPYGADMADKLVSHHVARGGVSRYLKFQYFLDNIVPSDADGPDLAALLEVYAEEVKAGLIECEVAPGLHELRAVYPQQRWMIVSGGDQKELRSVFAARGLDELFDGGIYGSPDTKSAILAREIKSGNVQNPALFLGDSKYDHIAAMEASMDFIFLSEWSEFNNYSSYLSENSIEDGISIQNVLRNNL